MARPGETNDFKKPKNTGRTIRRLLSYITDKPILLVCIGLCLIISTLGGIAGVYMLRPILNELVASGTTVAEKIAYLGRCCIVMLIVYLAGMLASYGQSALMAYVAQKGVNHLRSDLFSHLEELPLSYFDRHTHGELMSRFTNDADNVSMALEQSVVSFISSALTFIALVAVMLYTSPLLFIITAIAIGVMFIFFKILGTRSAANFRQQQKALGEVNGNIQEIIEGLKVVKAFNHEEQCRSNFAELNERYRVSATDAAFYSGMMMPTSNSIINIGYAITAVVGGLLSMAAGLDLGGFAIFLQYSRQITQPMSQISQQMTNILSALAGAERIFEIMDEQPETDEGDVTLVPAEISENGEIKELENGKHAHAWAWKIPNEDGTVELRQLRGGMKMEDVCFSYVPGKPILRHISFYAKPGQKIAFVGSTGAGKTTITNLFNRFYEIDSGLITYDHIDVRRIRKADLRRSMGAVLQDTHLFTGTVMDNIRYGRLEATDEEVIAAAKSANAHSFIRRLPNGYETMITGDGANLSQGQRQLLAIARAACADPPVMIMDEATSSIDTRTERHIEKGMDELMKGRTVFVIAHRLSTVRNSDCIVVIEHGQIEEKGNHNELLDLQGRYYRLYTGQNILD